MRRPRDIDSPFQLDLERLPRGQNGLVAWDQAFGRDLPLRIEIGVGNSTFLIDVALSEPRFNYLGFELTKKRIIKFLNKVHRAGIDSIRLLGANALDVLDDADVFARASVDHIFLNFPDPWPKRRHAHRRFVQPEQVEILARLIRAGGGFSLRTDSPRYAAQMLQVLDASPWFSNRVAPGALADAPIHAAPTSYEIRFRAEGRKIHYLEYVANERPRQPRAP